MKRRVLLINSYAPGARGGRARLCELNEKILRDIFGNELTVVNLHQTGPTEPRTVLRAARGHIDGINSRTIGSVIAMVLEQQIDRVFIDGSNLGAMARALRRCSPRIRIVVFFHNVEAFFFLGSVWRRRSLVAVGVLLANYIAERMAVTYADVIVALSARDSDAIHRLYGRHATAISAIAVLESFRPESSYKSPVVGKYLLFVGGAFYANIEAIDWFATNVASRIALPTYIVGRGLEALQHDLARHPDRGRLHFVGEVDDLGDWYVGAHLCIAPIFGGSGMKTKVAEAFMFGKPVLGTSEAFSGYDLSDGEFGRVCNTAGEFIEAIEYFASLELPPVDHRLRRSYQSRYSAAAARQRIETILRLYWN